MKAGDIVRFKSAAIDLVNSPLRWRHGLLIEYNTWEKIATILWRGQLLRCSAEQVEKAGKKDARYDELY